MNYKESYLDQSEQLLKLQSFNEMHSIKRFLRMDLTGIGVQLNIKIYLKSLEVVKELKTLLLSRVLK